MMTFNKRALFAVFLIIAIPLLNGCKEDLEEQNLTSEQTTENSDPNGGGTDDQLPEATFEPIQINAAPADLIGYSGQTAIFSVTASSSAALSYQWFHNNIAIENATGATLSFVISGDEDAGNYRVDVINRTTSVSASAVLLVSEPPAIKSEPQDVSVYPGESATFTVNATGDNIEYQWQSRTYWGWKTLTETSDTLQIDTVTDSTTKQYRVKVKNGGGEKTSRTTRINMKNPIVISTQPANQLVAEGSNAVFSVEASGYGILSYRWYKGGSALSNSSKFQGTTSATLSVLNVTAADASLYHVVISNDDGKSLTSNAAELAVQGPAVVTVQPVNTTVYSGETGYLRIAASGDKPIAYQWQKWNGSSWQNVSGATSSTLSFASATSSTAGRYRCKISNAVSSDTSNEASVTVLMAAKITSSPTSQSVQAGDSVTFTVSATGDDLQYEWSKNGQVIPGNSNSLSFAAVRELDEATYGCRVYNNGSSASCASFKLTIQSPVQITTQPTSQSTYENGSVSLSVAASGDPAPTVEWYFNGAVVGTGNTLPLNYIKPEQAGEYQCLVKNEVNSVYCDVVTVTVSPSVKITSQPTSTSADEGGSVNFTLTASGDGLSYDWSKNGSSLGINGPSLVLSNLTADDAGTYSCRVWNQNSSANCDSFALSVNGSIAIINQPVGATAYEDDSVSLTVSHDGGSDARVQWYFNDTLLSASSATLTLSPLTLSQAGEYRCVVSNPVNSVACNPVSVSVLEKVRITKQLSSQVLSAGDTFKLDIEATGQGPLLYECYVNGTLFISTNDPGKLLITNVGIANEGNYYCGISNEGSAVTSAMATLSVVDNQARLLLISWQAPSTRVDGSLLDPLDIKGYSVHVRAEGESTYQTVAETPTSEATIELSPGSYFLTITTLDASGLESSMSAEYPITVQ